MVRPKTLGEEKEDSEEEEEEIQIVLTSKDPNVTSRLIRWTLTIFNLMKMIFVSDGTILEDTLSR